MEQSTLNAINKRVLSGQCSKLPDGLCLSVLLAIVTFLLIIVFKFNYFLLDTNNDENEIDVLKAFGFSLIIGLVVFLVFSF